jgi:hypothetical protein
MIQDLIISGLWISSPSAIGLFALIGQALDTVNGAVANHLVKASLTNPCGYLKQFLVLSGVNSRKEAALLHRRAEKADRRRTPKSQNRRRIFTRNSFSAKPYARLSQISTIRHESADGPIRDANPGRRTHKREARRTRVVLHTQDILPPPPAAARLRPASGR